MQALKIPVKYIDSTKYKVKIYQEEWVESPTEWGNFQIVQFRDNDFNSYGDIADYTTESGRLLPSVQAKLRAGKMFTFNYYRYSNADGGHYKFDGSINLEPGAIDGFIILADEYIKGISYAERHEYAIQDLKTYTQYAQGDVYAVAIETADGREVDSCGGLYGTEGIKNFIAETIPGARYEAIGIHPGRPSSTYEVAL